MKIAISNAFTTMPIQDKFGSVGFPSNGLTKLEYFALEIYKAIYKDNLLPETLIKVSIEDAVLFLKQLEETQKNLTNENSNTTIKKSLIEP
jgi:hypothetical protein